MTTAQPKKIEIILQEILVEQKKTSERLDVINRRLMTMEDSIRRTNTNTQNSLVHIKRLRPYIEQAMGVLHQAFKMVCNGILNQREEISEFAGNVVDTEYDNVHIV